MQLSQLKKDMEAMKIKYEENITTKDLQICEMQELITRYKYIPSKDEFIKEYLELNSQLSIQQGLFCQKMFIINPYLETSEQLENQVIDQRDEFEELNTKI